MQFLRLYYWILYAAYINDPMAEVTRYTHKEELAFRFMHYIIEEHSPDKDVTYYARKLGLSAKSLTNLIRVSVASPPAIGSFFTRSSK